MGRRTSPRQPRRIGKREASVCLTLDLFGDTPGDVQPHPAPSLSAAPPPEAVEHPQSTAAAWEPSDGDRAAAEEAVARARLEAESHSARLSAAPDDGPLTTEAARAIRDARIDGTRVILSSALPREVYTEVAEAFQRIGGRWIRAGRKRGDVPAGYHGFPIESVALVRALAESGRLPPRNPTSFFPSPPPVVDRIMEAADVGAAEWCEYRFLEPHAGQGAIAERIRATCPGCPLDVVEILDLNRRVLRSKGFDPIAADFLRFNPGPIYDRVLANPPFRLPGSPKAYQDHIRHGWELLRDGGTLVSVAPGNILQSQSQDEKFLRWVAERGTIEELPDGSFEASGTGVSTALIWLEKRDVGWKSRPFMGWGSWNAWQTALWTDNDWDLYQQERALHRRVHQGEFGRTPVTANANWALAGAVRPLYEAAVKVLNRRPLYSGVYLNDADHAELLEHFVARYHEHAIDNAIAIDRIAA
jgi:hypothetical protein